MFEESEHQSQGIPNLKVKNNESEFPNRTEVSIKQNEGIVIVSVIKLTF